MQRHVTLRERSDDRGNAATPRIFSDPNCLIESVVCPARESSLHMSDPQRGSRSRVHVSPYHSARLPGSVAVATSSAHGSGEDRLHVRLPHESQ